MDNEDNNAVQNEDFDAFSDFIDEEFGDPAVNDNEDTGADEPDGEVNGSDSDEGTDSQSQSDASQESSDGEEPPVSEQDEVKHDVADDDQANRPVTKDSIKEALKELDAERQTVTSERQTLRDEVRNALYPNGVTPEPLLDSEGKQINGVSDIAGKLVNPETNDVFTWEEAKDWFDKKQTEQKDWINTVEQNIDALAETTQLLHEGEKEVMHKYGELLKKLPDVAKEAFDGYKSTLEIDKNTGVVLKAPISVTQYYDMVMRPYVAVAEQMQLQAQAEKDAAAAAQAKINQRERSDLGPSSNTSKSDEEKDDLDTAFDNYFNNN